MATIEVIVKADNTTEWADMKTWRDRHITESPVDQSVVDEDNDCLIFNLSSEQAPDWSE